MKNFVMLGVRIFGAVIVFCGSVWTSLAYASETVANPPTSSEQLQIAYQFSHQYSDMVNVLRALFGHPAELNSENALSMYNQLQKCLITEDSVKGVRTVSGEGCKINYKLESHTEDLGLNDNGDPVTETSITQTLQVLDQNFAEQAGLLGWTISRMERRDTLVSTPAHVLIISERMYVSTAAGREVEIDTKERLYTNMENQEQTFFNQQTFDFKEFIISYNVKVETTETGASKRTDAKINGNTVTLDEVIHTFTPDLVGVQGGSLLKQI